MIISCIGKVERSDSTDRNLLYLKKKNLKNLFTTLMNKSFNFLTLCFNFKEKNLFFILFEHSFDTSII